MKHQKLIDKMTLEEKAAFLSGKNVWQTRDFPRLNIPSIFMSDGPHGIRKQAGAGDHLGLNASIPATCYPTAATMANSWDIELGMKLGQALGEEAAVQNVNILLGPGLNIKRSPLCGRNFEYFSEDPYLSGKMAAAYVQGIQSKGVYACPKHFAVNSQELRRMAMNSVLDERSLREIYLTGFEIAVKEGKAKAIMTSYNEVNGIYANENEHLLMDILRKEWQFDGVVITDWGASNNHVKGVKNRSNLEMPSPGLDSAREIIEAIQSGQLSEDALNICVDDLLEAVLSLSRTSVDYPKNFDEKAHHELARKAAAESAVLLKNEGHILPLKKAAKVALIGDFAMTPRYQGAGSSMVNPTKIESISTLIEQTELTVMGFNSGYMRTGETDERIKKETVELAKTADVVIYCFGLDELSESEGMDRTHMRIPENQIELLQILAGVNDNIVGVLSGGAAVETPWEKCCKAILHGYLNGQAGARAVLDILTGKVNPSGKLAETYPVCYEDTPAFKNFPSRQRTAEYRESIYVGYRYYDTADIPVKYPFGYGLSYTDFEYDELRISDKGISFTLKNTGTYAGAEIVQMYVSKPESHIFRPKKELKGFKKVFLEPGEKAAVDIEFDDKTFRYWNIKSNQWETEGGVYKIMVGASCVDIRLSENFSVDGGCTEDVYDKENMPSYYSGKIHQVSDEEFSLLLGHSIPSGFWNGNLTENDAICQMYYAKSRLARFVYKCLDLIKKKSEAKGKPNLNILFIYNMPFRGIAKMTGGMVSMDMVRGIVEVVNGHLLKGLGKIIKGYFVNIWANKKYERKLSGE